MKECQLRRFTMFRKCILLLSVFFGLSTIAGANTGMSGDEASGFSGAFELKYKADLSDGGDKLGVFTHRARVNWAGEVDNMVMWKVGLSSNLESNFGNFGLEEIHLEQAYAAYMPLDGLKVKVGKFAWNTSFEKTGVLYDEDLYASGAVVKYHHDMFYAKAALIDLDGTYKGPFREGGVVKVMLGTKQDVSGVDVSASVGAVYDGLFKEDTDTTESVTLAKAAVHVDVPHLGIPVTVGGSYGVNVATQLENPTYMAGVHVNQGDSVHNFSVSVNYYDINETTWNTSIVDTDYIAAGSSSNGVAAKVAYNVWENSSVVAKYAYNLADGATNPHNLVGELTVNF